MKDHTNKEHYPGPQLRVPPVRRFVAPETDFYMVPLADAPEQVRLVAPRLLEVIELMGGDCFVAGGCLRDAILEREPEDIDVYFYTSVAWEQALKHTASDERCSGRTVVSHPIFGHLDLIYTGRQGPLDQMRSFDFVACCAALYATGFACHRLWLEQVRAGVLTLSACPNPAGTMRRLERLRQRGWSVRPGDLDALTEIAAKTEYTHYPRDLTESITTPQMKYTKYTRGGVNYSDYLLKIT